ncbi:hypothetical protein G6F36_010434 [Rhizopus arrhizus]|nr:hypothetical protein G6F36_010434 [Rhizopus arrhizus]
MPNQFIAENSLILNIAIEHTQRCKREDIALLLDQEKAYDRVHHSYLKKVLLKFGFPPTLVNSLIALFFGNRVCININGHFTNEVDQGRGLRQGDPLSPLLFNLVLEPFLRHILQDASIVGFSFSPLSQDLPPPATLKVLAYTDDVCVFLSSRTDFLRPQHHLNAYGQVSNAKVNLSKTETIFLNGRASPHWQQLLTQYQISQWHNHSKNQPLRYLGFPVIQSVAQRKCVGNQLLQSVKTQCGIYSQRHLSLRGRVTLANSLILSKLWYSLRVVSLTKQFFRQIRSALYQFITKGIKPGFRYTLLCQPITSGGLGLLDPVAQNRCLQIRWLRLLFQEDDPNSCSQLYLKDFVRRFHSSGTDIRLSFFFPPLRPISSVFRGSFMSTLYMVMDSFLPKRFSMVRCTPATLLCLPLLSLFSHIPDAHWLRKLQRLKMQARLFFTYDISLQCIRPLLRPDSPHYPRLAAWLLRDLNNRIITLNNMTWALILNLSPDLGQIDDSPFVSWLTRSPDWDIVQP